MDANNTVQESRPRRDWCPKQPAQLLEKELVFKVVGCAMTVHNEIGHGFREKTYERALCVELRCEQIECGQQVAYPVLYRGETIDEYIPDLVIGKRVIAEAKVSETITDEHRGQIINYLRISGLKVGIILNFKHPKLQWERLVLDNAR